MATFGCGATTRIPLHIDTRSVLGPRLELLHALRVRLTGFSYVRVLLLRWHPLGQPRVHSLRAGVRPQHQVSVGSSRSVRLVRYISVFLLGGSCKRARGTRRSAVLKSTWIFGPRHWLKCSWNVEASRFRGFSGSMVCLDIWKNGGLEMITNDRRTRSTSGFSGGL